MLILSDIYKDTYIFYTDVYFLQNFLIKIAVLYLSLYVNQLHFYISTGKGMMRIILASGIGTILEIAGLFLLPSYTFFLLLVHVVEIPSLVGWILRKERRRKWKVIFTGYGFIMLINAVLEVLWNHFGDKGYYVFYLAAACGMVCAGTHIWKNCNKMQKGIYFVELTHKGRKVTTYGLYDSGNQLKDPYTGKGVHIVSENVLKKLEIAKEQKVWIPYQSLGNEEGMLEVYYVEELAVNGETQRSCYDKCPLGITKDNLFHQNANENRYEIILNEEVF